MPQWFSDMCVSKLLLPHKMIRIFGQKTAIFAPKYAFLSTEALPAHLVPCWLDGWWLWRAGPISQDTYLLYCIDLIWKSYSPHSHSSLNFFIYCFASKRFRTSLRNLLTSLLPAKTSRENMSNSSDSPMDETSPLNHHGTMV